MSSQEDIGQLNALTMRADYMWGAEIRAMQDQTFRSSIVDAGGPLSYGEQCADTDGLAADLAGLQFRLDVAHRYIAELVAERAALRVELAQRKALPLNALRHGGIR